MQNSYGRCSRNNIEAALSFETYISPNRKFERSDGNLSSSKSVQDKRKPTTTTKLVWDLGFTGQSISEYDQKITLGKINFEENENFEDDLKVYIIDDNLSF